MISEKTEMSLAKGKPIKCYKCLTIGHIAPQYKRASMKKTCYMCRSTEHLARECPKRSHSLTPEMSKDFAQATSINIVQLVKSSELRSKIQTANHISMLATQ